MRRAAGDEIRSGASVVGRGDRGLRAAASGGFDVCAHRAPRGASRGRPARARRAWPIAPPSIFLPITLGRRGARLGRLRLAGRSARRARRRDTVPADPRNADRVRLGPCARCPARHRRQGRHAARAARSGHGRRLRQDRDADDRRTPRRRGVGRPARGRGRRRAAIGASARRRDPRRGGRSGVSALPPAGASARSTAMGWRPASTAGWCASAEPRSLESSRTGPRFPGGRGVGGDRRPPSQE